MAKTQIFKDYKSFLKREDKFINGVTENFIDLDADVGNVGCWNCENCENCTNCTGCTGCVCCVLCDDCVNCTLCVDCKGLCESVKIYKGE